MTCRRLWAGTTVQTVIADTTDDFDRPDANPKTIEFGPAETITFVAVHQSADLTDVDSGGSVIARWLCTLGDRVYQVKGFNGNTIQVSFTPATGGTFAVIKKVTVDNGKPILVSTSPEPGLIVKGGVDITFSADITDGGAGFDGKFKSDNTPHERTGLMTNLSTAGTLVAGTNDDD